MSSIVAVTSLALMHPALIAGVFQWPLLRRHIAGSASWMVANVLAVAIPSLVNQVVILDDFTMGSNKSFDFAVKLALNFFLIGFAFGLAQWVVLRRPVVSTGR